ncbi:MAG: CoA protein activase [Bacillota bacterium]|nr:CoA protein activase [Bacillota bacterium]
MILTFPHMGNTYITAKVLLDELGVSYVIPPLDNQEALSIGARYAPELACLPLKINLGNYIKAYEQGADTILITGGCGPCRFGYYSEIEQGILRDLGIKMDVIALEKPDAGLLELMRRIYRLSGYEKNVNRVIGAVKKAARISALVDELERQTFRTRPRETAKGSTDRIYSAFRENVLNAKGYDGIKKLIGETSEKLSAIKVNRNQTPLKIGIVGEIYTTIDSATSFNLDIKLGNLGVEVDRAVTVSGWIIDHMFKKALRLPYDTGYVDAAKPYLKTMIGGHAQETVGHSAQYADRGFDGIIQIYPLSCMPEIVAQSVLPGLSRDKDIPVMTLIIDEMSGEAGYMTRIEAFLDVLDRRRERSIG